jgi:tyrosinase
MSAYASRGDQVIKEWSARVSCKEHQVGGSFSVFIFLGDVPPDPDRWLTDPALAGIFDVYTGIEDYDDDDDDRDVRGIVLLNRWLSEKSDLPSLNESVVVPFLKRKINWAVRSVGNHLSSICCTCLTFHIRQ